MRLRAEAMAVTARANLLTMDQDLRISERVGEHATRMGVLTTDLFSGARSWLGQNIGGSSSLFGNRGPPGPLCVVHPERKHV